MAATSATTCETCEQFAQENERYRSRLLELVFLADREVAGRVAAERRRADEVALLTEQLHRTEAELDALRNTRLMRAAAPARRAWAWLLDHRPARAR
jgi:hypothetical protein